MRFIKAVKRKGTINILETGRFFESEIELLEDMQSLAKFTDGDVIVTDESKYSALIDDLKTTREMMEKSYLIIKDMPDEMEAVLARSRSLKEKHEKEEQQHIDEEKRRQEEEEKKKKEASVLARPPRPYPRRDRTSLPKPRSARQTHQP